MATLYLPFYFLLLLTFCHVIASKAENSDNKIILRSRDGELFEVDEVVAVESGMIKHMIEDYSADNFIPLSNVTGKILSKVLDYCKRHAAKAESKVASDAVNEDDLKAFDSDFVKVDHETLFDLILDAGAAFMQ